MKNENTNVNSSCIIFGWDFAKMNLIELVSIPSVLCVCVCERDIGEGGERERVRRELNRGTERALFP